MSRIAGIIAPYPIDRLRVVVGEMLTTCQRGSSNVRQTRVLQAGQCVLGYAGDNPEEDTYQDERFIIVLDGPLLEFDHFGSPPRSTAPVHLLASLLKDNPVEDVFKKIVFDCTVAIFDRALDTAFFVRDKIGIQPLYYAPLREGEAFCSRIAGLMMISEVDRTPRSRYVAVFGGSHYRGIDNEPSESPISGILQVPAGSARIVRGGRGHTSRYWQLTAGADLSLSESDLASEYRERFTRAVLRRLNSSTHQAFTLSGGMDSSSVLATARSLLGANQTAFSSAYADATYDESAEIQSMLAENVSIWNKVQIEEPDLLSSIAEMINQHDEPVATVTWYSHFRIVQAAAAQGIRTLFGGLGGDELNAGEYEYFPCFFADLRAAGREDLLRNEIQRWAEYHQHPIYQKNQEVAERLLATQFDKSDLGRCLPDRARIERYGHIVQKEFFDLKGWSPTMKHPFRSALKNRAFQDIFFETAPCCLRAQDRQGEAVGIRHSLPFFDSELVEFMFKVPSQLKIKDGVTKYLLRLAMKGILPEETRTRVKKTGWNAPAHLWFLQKKNFSDLSDLVASQRFHERGPFDAAKVLTLLNEHKEIVEGNRNIDNHMMLLWQIANVELWYRWIEDFPRAIEL